MCVTCITLTQPWATLIAIGAKRIETRSWPTNHRGRLYIHAAKKFPQSARNLCICEPAFMDALADAGINGPQDLPLGCIVGWADLVVCESTNYFLPPDLKEEIFGNYGPDRFAWVLRNPRRLEIPITAAGRLGLWTIKLDLSRQDTLVPEEYGASSQEVFRFWG